MPQLHAYIHYNGARGRAAPGRHNRWATAVILLVSLVFASPRAGWSLIRGRGVCWEAIMGDFCLAQTSTYAREEQVMTSYIWDITSGYLNVRKSEHQVVYGPH